MSQSSEPAVSTFPGQWTEPTMEFSLEVRVGSGAKAKLYMTLETGKTAWCLDWLFVPLGHRGRGLAGMLMRTALAYVDSMAEPRPIVLEARLCHHDDPKQEDQDRLVAFYRGYGFLRAEGVGELGGVPMVRPRALPAPQSRPQLTEAVETEAFGKRGD